MAIENLTRRVILMYLHLLDRNKPTNRGRPMKADYEECLDKIWMVLKSGMQWRFVTGTANWNTYYKRFRLWASQRVFENSFKIIQKIIRSQGELSIKDRANLYIDSTMIKNIKGQDKIGINHYDRGRKGSKITVIVTSKGIPLGISMTSANINDVKEIEPVLDQIVLKIAGSKLIGDKGYTSRDLKTKMAKKRQVDLIYPAKSNSTWINTLEEKALLKTRNIVENFFSWVQMYRKLRLRYEVYSSHFKEMYYLALCDITSKKVKNNNY